MIAVEWSDDRCIVSGLCNGSKTGRLGQLLQKFDLWEKRGFLVCRYISYYHIITPYQDGI